MFIKGVGMTKFGTQEDPTTHLIYEASMEALDDSGLSIEEIDLIVVSNMDILSNGERQRHSASIISSLFQKKLPILTLPAGCAGGGNAVWCANQFLKNSAFSNSLVIGFDKLIANTSKKTVDEILMGGDRIYEQNEGLVFPAQNALVAQQYMLKYHATTDDFAMVAFKNHQNAFLNPKARFYRKSVTLEEIKSSPVVSSPLRIFDCSITCNGAAALVLTKKQTDVEVAASTEETDYLASFEREDMTSLEATRTSAKEAYSQAGVTPKEIDIIELHDAFTPLELISYEDLGFAKKGEGAKLIREKETYLNGSLPVNTSGGLKAKGHPISPTGIAQIYEIVKQMRSQADKRQIKKPKYGLAHNIGGVGSTATIHILKNLD